jgi:hypothetical protein
LLPCQSGGSRNIKEHEGKARPYCSFHIAFFPFQTLMATPGIPLLFVVSLNRDLVESVSLNSYFIACCESNRTFFLMLAHVFLHGAYNGSLFLSASQSHFFLLLVMLAPCLSIWSVQLRYSFLLWRPFYNRFVSSRDPTVLCYIEHFTTELSDSYTTARSYLIGI